MNLRQRERERKIQKETEKRSTTRTATTTAQAFEQCKCRRTNYETEEELHGTREKELWKHSTIKNSQAKISVNK